VALAALAGLPALGGLACTDDAVDTLPVSSPAAPGEICHDPTPDQVRARFHPPRLMLAPGSSRPATLIVDPEFCSASAVRFDSSDPSVAAVPPSSSVSYGYPTVELELNAEALGTTTIEAWVARGDGTEATAEIEVEVLEATPLTCSADDDLDPTLLEAGTTMAGSGSLSGASISLPDGADAPNSNSFIWSVSPFQSSIGCADDLELGGVVAMGPAVTFGPAERSFPRELPLSVPLNPARLPEEAEWRHLRMAYSGPAFKSPRLVAVADLRIEKVDGQWAALFKVPRLGTYQAVVPEDAGTVYRSRRLTHRAIVGVSMGGAGAAQFGLRHHHLFDVVAALGGPVDWTWMAHYMEQNHMGGFRPIAPGTQLEDIPLERAECTSDQQCEDDEVCLGVLEEPQTAGKCTLLPEPADPYEHTQTFNTWWYEYPRVGNGGRFPRDNYIQIFRDLALMFGNPNGYNTFPGGENLPAGVDPDHPSQTGDHPGDECKVWVDPLDGPDKEAQEEIEHNCPIERCSYTQVFEGYYDDEYNPDGTFPVITFCDGAPQNAALTPYANTWTPNGNQYPMEVALAVDYNGNGVRDELEPPIRAGHEPWDDYGEDQTPSSLEPGYGPDNLDPAGDDYDPQYNPAGTEGDHRRQPEEAFADTGLDGVMDTSDSPYDHGEGDGQFTVAPGLQRMWEVDGHSAVRQWVDDMPAGELDDDALGRVDLWTDGGTRDLFNFTVTARHLAGAFAARGRDVGYYTAATEVPGQDPALRDHFYPAHVLWNEVPGVVMHRYGQNEPTKQDVENGSGQHVGTATEITWRLQLAMYFIGTRWADAPRALVESSADKPAEDAPDCEIAGNCLFDFTSSDGRTGPVVVSLPPGYAHADLGHLRYPVMYFLHGYGQTPEDLQAAIVFLNNWTNGPQYSGASRLGKAILVYVDGRCRVQNGTPECIRGTFYADSPREGGAKIETWWLELIEHIDQNFRTMGEGTVEWTE